MPERPVFFKNPINDKIFAIIHEPDSHNVSDKVMIVFIHGVAGYRIGPHNLFVKMARRLCQLGFYCCRFDLRGSGYSSDIRNDPRLEKFPDLNTVLDALDKKYKPEKYILVGICSGAKIAVSYAMYGSRKIDYIIEMSSMLIDESENQTINMLRRSKHSMLEYFYKLFYRETWEKLFSGTLQWEIIFKVLAKPFLKLFSFCIKKFTIKKKSVENPVHQQQIIATRYKPFKNIKEILLIHGEKDPETNEAVRQISSLAKTSNIPFDVFIIPGANHSFYSLKWKKDIFIKIESWLSDKFKFPIEVNNM